MKRTSVTNLLEFHDGTISEKPQRKPKLVEAVQDTLKEVIGYDAQITRGDRETKITFRRGDQQFDSAQLSDGEKHLLLASVFLVAEYPGRFIFLVDEPELYLNEARAIDVWESLEAKFPRAVFLYATHNIVFATRPTVDATYLMGLDGNIEQVDRDRPIPSAIIRDIVGTRIQLLRSSATPIFCEDELSKLVLEDYSENGTFKLFPWLATRLLRQQSKANPDGIRTCDLGSQTFAAS